MKLNKKNKFLLLGFLALLYFCYSLAISKTIQYYKQYKSQQEIVSSIDNPKLLAALTKKEKQLDQWILENNSTDYSFQNELLKQLNRYCVTNNLKIVDFKEPHQFSEMGTITSSYSFSIEGDFNSVLKVINKIENNPSLGIVKYISSIKKLNYKTNENYLVTEVILEKEENNKQ